MKTLILILLFLTPSNLLAQRIQLIDFGGIKNDSSRQAQAANDLAIKASRNAIGGVYFAGPGTYYISESYQLKPGEQWRGDGYRSEIKFTGKATFLKSAHQTSIEGLRILGPGTGSNSIGISFDEANRNRLRNVYVAGFGIGILYKDSYITTFDDCQLSHNKIGFQTDPKSEFNNAFNWRGGAIEANGIGVLLTGKSRAFTFSSVTIEGNKQFGIFSPEGDSLPPVSLCVQNCYFESNGISDIHFAGRVDHASIKDNAFASTPNHIQIGVGDKEIVVGTKLLDNDHGRGIPIVIGPKAVETRCRPGYSSKMARVGVINSGRATVIE